MNIYFAPMEGITGYIYRNAFNDIYGGIDKYYAPFVNPTQNAFLNKKEIRDVLPENNAGLNLIPQILTNKSEYFLGCQKELVDMGYDEVNLNLGCPSATVVTKKKGSGLLYYCRELDEMLYEIFDKSICKISIKTRLGRDSANEFYELLDIFNKYDISELTIHPRIRTDFYEGQVNMEMFKYACENSKNKLVYNGDINTLEDYKQILKYQAGTDKLAGIMIGRGFLKNPGLISEIREFEKAGVLEKNETLTREIEKKETLTREIEKKETLTGEIEIKETLESTEFSEILNSDFLEFMERLKRDYFDWMKSERNVLFRLKELWCFARENIEDGEKFWLKMKKVKNFAEYDEVIRRYYTGL